MTESDIIWEYRMLTEKDKPDAVHDSSYDEFQEQVVGGDRANMKVIT